MNEQISHAYYHGTLNDLNAIHLELLNERQKIGEFIDMFLDKYDTKMNAEEPGGKLWKLYRKKHDEYCTIEQQLRNLKYFTDKKNVHFGQ